MICVCGKVIATNDTILQTDSDDDGTEYCFAEVTGESDTDHYPVVETINERRERARLLAAGGV